MRKVSRDGEVPPPPESKAVAEAGAGSPARSPSQAPFTSACVCARACICGEREELSPDMRCIFENTVLGHS